MNRRSAQLRTVQLPIIERPQDSEHHSWRARYSNVATSFTNPLFDASNRNLIYVADGCSVAVYKKSNKYSKECGLRRLQCCER